MGKGELNIIRASAGSGKTYTLARTYITNLIGVLDDNTNVSNEPKYKIRERNDFYNHILAITFTNKATNEMKERIIKQLFALSNGKGDYVDYFKTHFIYNDFSQVTLAAKEALCGILFYYGCFNVSTIDSFFQSILRNFARELDRDYSYEVQLDEEYATSVAVHDFLLDLGGDKADQKAIDNWVKDFITNNISQNKSWDFFGRSENIESFAKYIYKEFFREHHDDIVEYLKDIGNGETLSNVAKFKKAIYEKRDFHKTQLGNCISQYKPFLNNRSLYEDNINKRNIVYTFYKGVDDISSLSNSSMDKTLRNYANESETLTKRIVLNAFRNTITPNDCKEFNKLTKATLYHWDMMRFFQSIGDNIWNLGLLGKIDEKLEQYRKDTNSILIADTNELIEKVLDSGASFIYEHAGTKFYHYMIDEFQDTSRKQYKNFKPLLQESCDNGNSNLIIGDEKQSIYRFRNSDPGLLRDELAKDFKEYANNSPLSDNHRSQPAIVNFNNTFFKTIIDYYCPDEEKFNSLKRTYANIEQNVKATGKQGYVCFNFVKPTGNNEAKQSICKALPNYINTLRSRGYKMKDIAVLVGTNKEGDDVVEYILQYNENLIDNNDSRHINIVSSESLLLKNSPSVRLIISMLQFLDATQFRITENQEQIDDNKDFNKFLNNRLSRQKQYNVLHEFQTVMQNASQDLTPGKVLLQCFEKDALNKDLSIPERLEAYSRITQEVMPDKKSQLTNLTNIVDKIIAKYILPQVNDASTNGKIENSFIIAFLNIVNDFCNQHNSGTIKEFLDFWDTKKDKLAVSSPSSSDAVNVMTIHKAKGLEFKCVIVPFTNWELIKDEKLYWINREEWLHGNSTGKPIDDIGKDNDKILPPLIPVSTSKAANTQLFKTQIDNERERCLIDNLNKMYVAFTRPEDELHVFVIAEDTNNETPKDIIKNSEKLLLNYIPTLMLNETSFSSKEIGLSYSSDQYEENCTEVLTVKSFFYGQETTIEENNADYNKKSSKSDRNVKTAKMPNYVVGSKSMPVYIRLNNTTAAKNEGIKMHAIFSLISSCNDFDKALRHAQLNGLFNDNDYWNQQRFINLIDTIKKDKILTTWFDDANSVMNERTISSKDTDADGNTIIVHNRPDRIVKTPDGDILVIDYKFGQKKDTETVSNHSSKVRKYMDLLTMIGEDKKHMKGYLWYARYNTIVTVEPD